MTDDRLPLAELMAKTGDGNFLRSVAESVLRLSAATARFMEADPAAVAEEAVAEHSGCACRELRNELADAAHSCRLDDAQVYLSAACLVCGEGRRTTALHWLAA